LREDLVFEARSELESQADSASSFDASVLFNTHDSQMYLLADPFNRSYNPAKVYANSAAANDYKRLFRKAFKELKNGHLSLN